MLVMGFDAVASIPGARDVARAASGSKCSKSRFGYAIATRAGSGGNQSSGKNDEDGDDGKGILAVKKGVGSSWDCFLDEVFMRNGEGDGDRGGVGVSVEVNSIK